MPQWELSSKHRDEQYIDEPLAEELRPLFRIHWDNDVSDTEAEQGATLIAAAPAMYAIIKDMREAFYVKGTRRALLEVMERSKDVLAQAEGQHHE
jgi:hypothetical protein